MGASYPSRFPFVERIYTPLQLRDADPARIREHFNVVMQRTVMEC